MIEEDRSPGRRRPPSATASSKWEDAANLPVMEKEWWDDSLPLRPMCVLLCQREKSQRTRPRCRAQPRPASTGRGHSDQSSCLPQGVTFVRPLSYSEQRDVDRTQAGCFGGIHTVLSLEVKEQPGHGVHRDVGHHSKRIPTPINTQELRFI